MKIYKEMFARWKKYSILLCAERNTTPEKIMTGAQAWNIAYDLELPKEAYHVDKSINDDHIKTALKRIFPNAVFKN